MAIRTLGEYAAYIESSAAYPQSGSGSEAAREYTLLGLSEQFGRASGILREALEHDAGGVPSAERLVELRRALGDCLWFAVRAVVEHRPDEDERAWAIQLASAPPAVATGVAPGAAWRLLERAAILTDFRDVGQAMRLVNGLGLAAARNGWSLQEVVESNVVARKETPSLV